MRARIQSVAGERKFALAEVEQRATAIPIN